MLGGEATTRGELLALRHHLFPVAAYALGRLIALAWQERGRVGGLVVLSAVVVAVVGLLDVAVLVATGITFLMWFHRVRANLPALGVTDARWSPGWAVGWWFVPVMSLFRPYQVAAEVWQASDPAATQADWRQRPVGSLPAGAGGVANVTPAVRISWAKTSPN